MNKRILAGLTLTGVVILASCGQDITPTTSVPAAPSFAKAPACSFPTATSDGKAYLVDQKDAFFTALGVMQDAYKTGGAQAAVAPGFVALARIGVAANNGAGVVKGTPATSAALGNTLVNDLLLCMGYPTNIDFKGALGPTGLFSVRSAGTSTPVIARNLNASGALIAGAPLYGAEPWSSDPLATPTWPITQTVLFYGNTLGQSSIAGQTAAGTLFDLKTLPVVEFSSPIRAGVCDMTDLSARTIHQHTGSSTAILPPAGLAGFCSLVPPLSTFRGFTQMLGSLFTPKPLYAFALSGGGTGLIRGLSEIGPVIFTDSLAFQGNIPGAAVSDTIKTFDNDSTTVQFNPVITVRAVSKGGKVAMAGVLLKLQIVGNNGSYVEAPLAKRTAVTDADGYARFPNYYIDKAGGYMVTVTSEFGTVLLSNQFNISGQ